MEGTSSVDGAVLGTGTVFVIGFPKTEAILFFFVDYWTLSVSSW